MMATVTATYDGNSFVTDEKMTIPIGQRAVITFIDTASIERKNIDLTKYMGRGKKHFHDSTEIDNYIKELRTDDRL